jgi:hypothetical protein
MKSSFEVTNMEPFFFGPHGQLFGAFHPAARVPRRHGVLIAPPLFHEGIRAHFALRQISERCAAAGFDVLRFDYSGQGNSRGRSSDYAIQNWEEDLIVAANELTNICGSQVVTLIAVRFAANLASGLLKIRDMERLIFWDPIFIGDHWLSHLYEHRSNLRQSFRKILGNTDREFSGHETGETFFLNLTSIPEFQPRNVTSSAVISKYYRNIETLETITSDIERVEFDCGWQNDTSAILYPTDLIHRICTKLI